MNETSLRCPHCAQVLSIVPGARRSLTCPDGHRFDAAKQGYYNFLTGKGTNFTEDTAAMVAAREDFQAAGHYRPLAQAIAQSATAGGTRPRRILDAGAGTGYYVGELAATLDQDHLDVLALDISRYAMRRAAKLAHTTAVVWDVWRTLPTADASRDVVLNCFAPHNPAEFRRVLAPAGSCIVVTALPDHLAEVRTELGMLGIGEGKQDTLITRFAEAGLQLHATRELRYAMELDAVDLFNLAFMGPAGHHLDPEQLRRDVTRLGPRTVTAAFGISTFGHPVAKDPPN